MFNNFSMLFEEKKKKEIFWKIFLTDVSIEFWTFYSFIYNN